MDLCFVGDFSVSSKEEMIDENSLVCYMLSVSFVQPSTVSTQSSDA